MNTMARLMEFGFQACAWIGVVAIVAAGLIGAAWLVCQLVDCCRPLNEEGGD